MKPPSPEGYHLERELGRGGMGLVYLARELRLNRTVALKMLLHAAHAIEADVIRFLTEAEAIAKLNHPHIVPIYSLGQAEKVPFFVMEYLEGGQLSELVRNNPLEPKQAAELVEKLALAMQYAHSQEIIHRDLKPGNILLTSYREPKITDFGLAKRLDEVEGITITGQILGTPSYMAPEQARGDNHLVNASTDVYALGAILYFLLTGRPPFLGPNSQATMNQVLNQDPLSPRELQTSIPKDLETICLKCLRKDQRDRYSTAQELADDLRAFLGMRSISARPMGRLEKGTKWIRRNPSWAAMIFLFVAMLLSGTGVSLYFADRATEAAKAETERANELVLERDKTKEALKKATAAELEAGEKATSLARSVDELKQEREKTQQSLAYSNLLLAEATFNDTGTAQSAINLLASIPSRFQNWEHRYLRHKYEGSFATMYGHRDKVNSVSFSPDGNQIATGSSDGTIRIWDVKTGQSILELKGHYLEVTSVCFSPEGSLVASGSWDGTIRVWDTKSGQVLLQLNGHTKYIESVGFSPDGKQIVSGSADKTIRLWDAKSGQPLLQLKGHTNSVSSVCFSPDGNRIASGSYDRTIRIWDAKSGQPLLQLNGHTSSVFSVCFSPDGSRVASGSYDNIRVWDAKSGQALLQLKGNTVSALSVTFSPDGTRIASGLWDGTIRLWDAKSGQALLQLKGHTKFVSSVSFSPDGSRIASGSDDSTIRLWDAKSGQAFLQLNGHDGSVSSVCVSPDGSRVASGSSDGTIRIWNPKSGQPLLQLNGHTNSVSSVCFSPDGKQIVSGSAEKSLQIWSANSGQSLLEFKGHISSVNSLSLSLEGSQLTSRSLDKTVRVWDTRTGTQLSIDNVWFVWPMKRKERIAISSDGKYIYLGQDDGRIVRAPLELTQDELTFRRAMSRPDPSWHAKEYVRASEARNEFAMNFHAYAWGKAEGQLHFESNRFDQAFFWFVAAQMYKPKPPVIDWPELLPPPHQTR